MNGSEVVIVSAGLVTPIGLSLAETAASARARVARLREIEWRDRRFEPFVVGSVPEAALPDLAEPLADLPLQYREARMLRLAHAAIEEAVAPVPPAARPLPLLLGLPEHHTTIPLDPGRFLQHLDLQVPGCIDVAASMAAPIGRAAGLAAIDLAMASLASGQHEFVLVGGVDCLVDLYVLGTLDLEGRIRNEVTSDGFSPAEGAALLLLARADTARSQGLAPLAMLTAVARGHEEGHVYSEAPYLGEGLAATFAQLLATPPAQPIGSVFCSFNGERYWAREFGVARLRQAQAFDPEHQMEHPAECFGDLGSAHGAALAALAAHGVAHGYRRAPSLVYASSDRGERAAAIVDALS